MKSKCFYRRQLIQEKRLGKGAVAISIKNTFPKNIEIMSSSLRITIRLTQLQKNIYTPLTAGKNGGKILNVPAYPPRVEKLIEQFLFVNLPKELLTRRYNETRDVYLSGVQIETTNQ